MNPISLYTKNLRGFLKLAAPLRIVCDSSNGTTGIILRRLKDTKLNLVLSNQKPDGRFPAHGPDPWAKGAANNLKKRVRSARADFGVIFDADGDRAFFVDDKGRLVPQEALILLFKDDFPPPYLIDIRMGWLVKKAGLKLVESRVGHFFMRKIMREKNLKLGAEFSGHTYFEYFLGGPLPRSPRWSFGEAGKSALWPRGGGRRCYFDSGLRSLVHFANGTSRLKAKGKKLSEWLDSLPRYYRSGEINFRVADKKAAIQKIEARFKKSAHRVSRLDGLFIEFGKWWFSVRPSNTEPLLRLNIEAKNKKILARETKRLTTLIVRNA